MQAPYNSFASARRLLGPETRFVSPNNDTLYVGGQCDVRQGPLALHVPDTHDRYYVLQFIDAWTNNFAYIGRRATGTAEAEYLLTDRDYDGPVPDGMRVVAAPTGVFTIVGRVQLNGEADLPAVNPLQDQFTITPPRRSGPAAGQGRRGCARWLEQRLARVRHNLDHLGPGTIDAPEWKIPDRAKAYVMRAMAARAGLWGNHGYEADYALAWTDGDGQPLDGPTATSCGWSRPRRWMPSGR